MGSGFWLMTAAARGNSNGRGTEDASRRFTAASRILPAPRRPDHGAHRIQQRPASRHTLRRQLPGGGITPSSGIFLSPPTGAGNTVNSGTGIRLQSVVAADFNGDSIPDLAAVNQGDNTVIILIGNGDGTYSPVTGSPISMGIV